MIKDRNAKKSYSLNYTGWGFSCFLLIIAIVIGCNITNAQTWVPLNSGGVSVGQAANTSIAVDMRGVPYVVYMDVADSSKATVMKYDGSNWHIVGSAGFSGGFADFTSIVIDSSGTPYVVYEDAGSSNKATVMKFDGTDWVTVGNTGFSAGDAFYTSIAISKSGIPYVAYEDGANGDKLTVMRYDGSSWVTVGGMGLSAGPAHYTSIAIDIGGMIYVAFEDGGNSNKATVMKYNGIAWGTLGNAGFSSSTAYYTSIALDGSGVPYIAFQDWGYYRAATVMKYSSGSWTTVGSSGFSAGIAFFTSVALDTFKNPYVVYQDLSVGITGLATVMGYDGSGWSVVGKSGCSVGNVNFTSIAIDRDNTPYISFVDGGVSNKAIVMKLETVTGIKTINKSLVPGLSVYPNPTQGSFTINLSSPTNETAQITITNMLGQTVKEFRIVTNKETEVQTDAPPGIYFLQAATSNGLLTQKLIISP
jgi:hypothetical protein